MKNNGLVINGYQWIYFSDGIHCFSKKDENGYSVIECTEKQIKNGDIEFMTEHNLTINKKLTVSLK